MEEDNMLNLFSGDSADFLDELTQSAPGDNLTEMCLSNGAGAGLLDPGINDVAAMLNPTMQAGMRPQIQQQQASYMMAPNIAVQQQKLQHFATTGDFNQFPQQSSENICHMTDGSMMAGGAVMGSSRQQFGSPPVNSVGMAMPNTQGAYAVYPLHGSPHVTPPRQTTPQPQMWPDATPQQVVQQAMPPGGMQVVQQVGDGTGYMSHHDYAMPATNQQQRLSHYGDQPQQVQGVVGGGMENNTYGMAQLGSPPSVCRLMHMPMSGSAPINKVQQQPQLASCNVASYESSSSPQNSFIGAQTQRLQHVNFSSITGVPQPTIQVSTAGQAQVLNTYHQGSQQQQPVHSQVTVEAPPLSHFQQCSVNQQQPLQYQQQQPTLGGPAANQLRTIAPRPVTPQLPVRGQLLRLPPAPSSQANLQQITLSAMPSCSVAQPAFTSHSNYANQPPLSTVATTANRTVTAVDQAGVKAATSQRIIISGAVVTEIQQLQQQIQQLYNMPQTPVTQQKMLDLQESMRTLKTRQQQVALQEQRLQKQQTVSGVPQQQQAAKKMQFVQIMQPNVKTLLKQGEGTQQGQQPHQLVINTSQQQTITLPGGQKVMTIAAASQPQQTVTLSSVQPKNATMLSGQQQTVTLPSGQQKVVTLPGGQQRQQTVTLSTGQHRIVTLPGGQQKVVTLPGGQQRNVTLSGVQQQTVTLSTGQQRKVTLPSGQQKSVTLSGLQQQTITLPGGRQQVVTLPGGQQQTVTLTGGQQQTVTLPGGQQKFVAIAGGQQKFVTLMGTQQQPVSLAGGQQLVALAGGQQKVVTVTGGLQKMVTLSGGQQKVVTLPGGQQKVMTMPGGQQKVVTMPGGQQKVVTLPGGQQKVVTMPGGQQKVVTLPGGQQKVVTLPGGQQKVVTMPGGQQKVVTMPGGQQKVVTMPGGQQKLVTMPGGQQKVVTMPGGQQKVVTMPGGQQKVVTMPGGQQKVVMMPGGQQKVVTMPGGQQKMVAVSGGQQKILTLPGGQQQIVTLATNQPQTVTLAGGQPQMVAIVGGQQKMVTIGGTIQQQRRQIMLQLQPAKQEKTAAGTLATQRPKPIALQPKPVAVAPSVAQTITIDSSDTSSTGLQDLMRLDDDLMIECETVDLDDDDATGLSPLDTPTLIHSPDDSEGGLSKEQQKANRIIAEAIAKAAAEGKAIPKVLTVVIDGPGGRKAEKKSKKKKEPRPPKEKKPREPRPKKIAKPKPKSSKKKKMLPIFLKSKKKRKRNASSDVSDGEPSPHGHGEHAGIDDMDGLTQRRSSRQVKRKKYADDLDLNLSDDDDDDEGKTGAHSINESNASFFVENPDEGDAQIVEKILGMHTVQREVAKENFEIDVDSDGDDDDVASEMEVIDVEEFYVKYKNFSFLHCEWRTAEQLERGDKRILMKIKRFRMKKLQQNAYFATVDDEEFFNPEYVEIDRVLEKSVTTDPATEEEVTYYLVKWNSLPYEDSTWELEQDVDGTKVELFERFNRLPSDEDREYKERPDQREWVKREESETFKNGNKLREYQLEGVNWLAFNYYCRQSSILADEMGLGKTIQSITFLQQVLNYGIRGPFLIIVPLSTIANWQREFELWVDMNVIVYHGTTPSRSMIQEYEMYYRDENGAKIPGESKFTVLITTFEIIISDCELLSDIDWRVCIIDEAHRLKNKNCKLMEGLKIFDLEHRILLTGTPLQNNVEELFSLLNFLEPKQFSSVEAFLVDFGDLKSDTQVQKLKALLKPVMLRRLKEDVEKTLAPKEETIVEVELTNIQKKYYRAILERNFTFLAKGGTSTNVPNLMNTMMELRKCCNHPYLVAGAEDKIMSEAKQTHALTPDKLFHLMVQSAGKLVLVDKLLPKLKAGDHKVLVFSQMIRVLDILEDYLIQKKYVYERIDGRIRGNLRQEAIDRFSKPDSDRFIFLLCTRAGGLGINLTAADTVIIYDSDWNPQNDLQAQARCHRIGQQKAVKVYRLVTRNSYEREMFDRASMKLGLDKAVLQQMGGPKETNQPQTQMSKKDIEELLKKGAYGAIMDDDNVADQFCEEDIDQILQRRTQVIKIETEGKGSTFSKASFSVSDNRNDIDIADPNFWQKWAKKADLDLDEFGGKKELIMAEPRQRRQTTRYGNQDSILDMSELDTDDSEEDAGAIEDVPGRHATRRRKSGRRGRRMKERHEYSGHGPIESYTRSDCFKVEKNLLVYGWGRWNDILLHGRFKRRLQVKDVETIARAMLVYSLKHYAGDERIKGFIYDLVTPSADGREKDYRNHLGLSAPVPRGRKGKKAKKDMKNFQLEENLARCSEEMERIISDDGYKKHLKRHANKVLLRVRLLYYLKQEVVGYEAEKVFSGLPAREVNIPTPYADGDPPAFWWDSHADRSLLVGVFKHGYEKYNTMRMDPALCFLNRCGAPDGRAVLAEQNDDDDFKDEDDKDPPDKNKSRQVKCDDEDDEMSPGSPPSYPTTSENAALKYNDLNAANGTLPFPLPSDLNTRLRRVITGYQRSNKREQLKQEQKAKKVERRERFQAVMKEREQRKRDAMQSRWSRREEADFYRVVSTFGVERDLQTGEFRWDMFRSIARLDKKYDQTLTEYFRAFYHMAKRVCRKFKTDEEAIPPNDLFVEPITEERATRCLARIELLNRVREHSLWHPQLNERLSLSQSSPDMPDWWINGEHDKDLLIGTAKHGLARTDYHILYDPKLAFREIVMAKMAQSKAACAAAGYPGSLGMPQTWPAGGDSLSQEATMKPAMNVAPSGDTNDDVKTEKIDKSDADFKEESVACDIRTESVKVEGSEYVKEEIKVEETAIVTVKSESPRNEGGAMDYDDGVDLKVPAATVEVETESFVVEESGISPDETVVKTEPPMDVAKDMQPIDSDSSDDELDDYGMPPVDLSFAREKLNTPQDSTLGDDDTSLDMTIGSEMTLDSANQPWNNPFVQWPKDRVIFQRIEQLCYCIDSGEWPGVRLYATNQGITDSRSSTPAPCTPGVGPMKLPGTPVGGHDYTIVGNAGESGATDGLKMTFHKRRKRRKKAEMELERAAFLQEKMLMLASLSDDNSGSNLSDSMPPDGASDSIHLPHNFGEDRDAELRVQAILGEAHEKKKKGRRRKIDKWLEGQPDAAAFKQSMALLASMQPDARVPVIHLLEGTRLAGDDAPTRRDLALWLEEHPGYAEERPTSLLEEADKGEMGEVTRKQRRPRVDPSKLDLNTLTGDENVSVINRETGKKITGAKAPPLKFLKEWLEKNPGFDIDGKWATVVAAKGNLPESLRTRVTVPSGRRGRKPANSEYLNSLSSMAALSNSAGLMGYPMGMPFGGLAGFGLPNPVYAAAAGFGATPEVSSAGKADDDSDNETADAAKDGVPVTTPSLAWPTAAVPHMSFPLVYNPMMFNPVYAQSLNAAASYMLPTSADASYMLPNSVASFASLAHAPMDGATAAKDNATSPVDSDEGDGASAELIAEDLSMKKSATPEGDTEADVTAGNVSDTSSDSAPGGAVKDVDSSSGSEEDATDKVPDDSNVDSATEQS